MRKQEIWNAVHEVGIHTRAAEELIESALAELAQLQAKVVHVSNVAGVSYSTLQDSFEGVSSTINELVKVRGTMARCHEVFLEAKEQIPGVRPNKWGDPDPCCPKIAETDLRVVA
jgi:DNA replicative helicase MCM subunit Mcm2 (Cdc46/Mcm family)